MVPFKSKTSLVWDWKSGDVYASATILVGYEYPSTEMAVSELSQQNISKYIMVPYTFGKNAA